MSYLLGFTYVMFSLYLHSGPMEMFTDTCSREELYTFMGAGFAFFGIILELTAQSVSNAHWTEE